MRAMIHASVIVGLTALLLSGLFLSAEEGEVIAEKSTPQMVKPAPEVVTSAPLSEKKAVMQSAELNIKVDGLRNSNGQLLVLMYNDAQHFESNAYNDAVLFVSRNLADFKGSILIKDIAPGNYAISLFHDENRNNEFDYKGMMPLEGYAYSNNTGYLSEPFFDDAGFKLAHGSNKVIIKMIYH